MRGADTREHSDLDRAGHPRSRLPRGGADEAHPATRGLQQKTPYVEDFTDAQIKTIGTLEVLGAIGVVVPAAIGVAPILTPIAACGLALTMVVAAATLIRRGELSHVPLNIVMFALAVFVAIERFGPYAL